MSSKLVPASVSRAVHRHQFHVGLRYGVVALAVGSAISLLWWIIRRRLGEPGPRALPLVGLLLAAAVLLGIPSASERPGGLVVGLLLLAVGGTLADAVGRRWGGGRLWTVLFAVPGGWELAWHAGLLHFVHPQRSAGLDWVRPVVLGATILGGVALADFDQQHRRQGWTPLLIAVTAVGIYATVPDTEQALVLVGAALPLAALGWPLGGSLGTVGALPVAGLLSWVAAFEGRGRPGSIVASLMCLGLMVAEPVGRAARSVTGRPAAAGSRGLAARAEWASVVGAHILLAAWASRAGHRGGPARALALGAPPLIAVSLVVALSGRPGRAPDLRSAPSEPSKADAREPRAPPCP